VITSAEWNGSQVVPSCSQLHGWKWNPLPITYSPHPCGIIGIGRSISMIMLHVFHSRTDDANLTDSLDVYTAGVPRGWWRSHPPAHPVSFMLSVSTLNPCPTILFPRNQRAWAAGWCGKLLSFAEDARCPDHKNLHTH